MKILEEIVAHKKKEIATRKQLVPIALLEGSIHYDTPTVSLCKYLLREDKQGIIAEFKRRSPSNPNINLYASVEEVSIAYMQAGASALSVLTDEHFFGGKNEDLRLARKFNYAPILRKDFVVDEYQIIEAKSIGADAVLLIADCLSKSEVKQFSEQATSLGMEVLFEIREEVELDKLSDKIDLVGVNNRNLKDFTVSIEQSLQLAERLPTEMVKVSESGIERAEDIIELRLSGFQGFLIGTSFMAHPSPGKQCQRFLEQLANASVKTQQD